MKKYIISFAAAAILMVAGFTGCSSKSGTWSQQDKDTWTTKCMQFMTLRGVEQKDAKDFCDCMLKKTSDKYTPAEAAQITPDEEQKLWQECNYQW